MPRRAAGQNHDPFNVTQHLIGDLDFLQEDLAAFDRRPAEDGFPHRPGLLEDLLEHEVLVSGLLGHDRIPRHARALLRDGTTGVVGELHAGGVITAISSSPRNTTSRVWLSTAGMSDATKNSRSPRPTTIGGPLRTVTILFGSSAEMSTSANNPRRSGRATHGVFEPIVAHLALDEVRHDFRVGLGDEAVTFLLELSLQIEIVLDDPVVHHDDLPCAVAVRVRIFFSRPAVCRPSCVANSVIALERVDGQHLFEAEGKLSGAAPQLNRAIADNRHPRGVVAAVSSRRNPSIRMGSTCWSPM